MQAIRDVRSFSGYFAALVGLGLIGASLGPTLPSLATRAQVSLAQIGTLLFVRAFGEMFGCLGAGLALDRGRGKAVFIASVVASAASLAAVPVLPSLALLAPAFLLLGAGQGALHTGANTWLVWRAPRRANSLLSILHFSFGVGAVIAPLLTAASLPFRQDGLFVYWVLALLMVPAALPLILGSPAAPGAATEDSAQRRPSPALLGGAVGLFFLYVGAEVSVGGWLYTYALRAANLPAESSAYLVAVFWGAFTMGRFIAIFASSRIESSRYVIASLTTGALSSVAMLLSVHGPGLWVAVAALGLSMSAVFPQAVAYMSATLGLTGRRTAALLVAGSCGGMLVPWAAGLLIASWSGVLPVVTGALMVSALATLVAVRRMTKRSQPQHLAGRTAF